MSQNIFHKKSSYKNKTPHVWEVLVAPQVLEPRTNGLRGQCSPFVHAGFTVHV